MLLVCSGSGSLIFAVRRERRRLYHSERHQSRSVNIIWTRQFFCSNGLMLMEGDLLFGVHWCTLFDRYCQEAHSYSTAEEQEGDPLQQRHTSKVVSCAPFFHISSQSGCKSSLRQSGGSRSCSHLFLLYFFFYLLNTARVSAHGGLRYVQMSYLIFMVALS